MGCDLLLAGEVEQRLQEVALVVGGAPAALGGAEGGAVVLRRVPWVGEMFTQREHTLYAKKKCNKNAKKSAQ